MGPGPSSVTPGVLQAMARPPIGYLDPELFDLLNELRAGLRSLFATANSFTIPLTGTGMAGMECCLANLLEPGDEAVVGVMGFFGARIAEIAKKLGAEVTVVEGEWGRPIDPALFEKALQGRKQVKLLACVHAETSTGVFQTLQPVASLAKQYGALFAADTVTSLGGMAVDADINGIDAAWSGTQKCVGVPPGLSPITVSERAMNAAANRKTPQNHWFFDWQLLKNYFDGAHAYHHTVPVNLYYGLAQALHEIEAEGMQNRFERHHRCSSMLMNGLQELGLQPFAQEGCRLPTLNTVRIPASVADEAALRRRLLEEYGIEIGGGLGALKGQIWRIGTMGACADERSVLTLLAAMRTMLH